MTEKFLCVGGLADGEWVHSRNPMGFKHQDPQPMSLSEFKDFEISFRVPEIPTTNYVPVVYATKEDGVVRELQMWKPDTWDDFRVIEQLMYSYKGKE